MMKKLFFTFILLFICVVSYAQFTVTNNAPYHTPANLINNVLLGDGVVATNIQFYGDTIQMGYFNGGDTVIGLDSGIVLTTGRITQIPVDSNVFGAIPSTPNSGSFGPTWFGSVGSNNLLTVSTSVPTLLNQTFPAATSVLDAAVLSFDFVPSSDSVEFRYVFASQEWNQFPCTAFNDVFGFFVSGPGINGTFNSPPGYPNPGINVAYFTDSNNVDLPITISSIHPGSNNCGANPLNDQYYNDNQPNLNIQFNGYTTILTAKFAVIPCDTYNIALSIGDGSDGSLHSGVFIEAKSFISEPIEVNAVPSYNTFGADSLLYEGCGQVEIEFKRFAFLADSATVGYSIEGTATNGTDYSLLPDSILFLPNQDSSGFIFTIADDGINEGTETLIIKIFPDTSYCFYDVGDTQIVTLYINDRPTLTIEPVNDTILCNETTAEIGVNILAGIPDFQFIWDTGDTLDSITVNIPQNDTTYQITTVDACGFDTIVTPVQIIKAIPDFILSVENDTVQCPDTALLYLNVLSGTAPHNYSWNTGAANDTLRPFDLFSNTYYYTVTDQCRDSITDSVQVVVNRPELVYNDTVFQFNCTDSNVVIFPDSISAGQPTFLWDNGTSASTRIVAPDTTTLYFVTISDICSPTDDSVQIQVIPSFGDPIQISDFLAPSIDCPGDTILFAPQITGGFSPYTFVWNGQSGADSIFSYIALADTQLVLQIIDQCTTSLSDSIQVIIPQFSPLSASFVVLEEYCIDNEEVITVNVTGGDGTYIFNWNSSWPFTIVNDESILVTVDSEISQLSLELTDGCNTQLVEEIDLTGVNCSPSLPNVITPNGDGINDFLHLVDLSRFEGSELYVYNRWGQVVFYSDDYRNNWGAEFLNDGTYFYTLVLSDGRKFISDLMIKR